MNTATGSGSKVMGGAGAFGYLDFDLGSIKTVFVGARVGLWSTAGNIGVLIDSSDDGVEWRMGNTANESNTSTTETIRELIPRVVAGRYIRLRFYVSTVSPANARVYQVMGWERVL